MISDRSLTTRQAAVNHNSIADTLSQSVADITAKVATSSNYLKVTPTDSMKRRLAEIYSQLFRFYRDALEWYMQSSTSKFFGSFNANVKSRFQDAVKTIENLIDQMVREGDIATLALLRDLRADVTDIKSEIYRQRQSYPLDADAHPGMEMLKALADMYREYTSRVDGNAHFRHLTNFEGAERLVEVTSQAKSSSREEARQHSQHLEEFIIGDEGPSLLSTGRFWLVEDGVRVKLQDWLAETNESRTLWISSPYEPQSTSSAEAAAMGVVAAAWQAEAPMLSHFCQRPSRNVIPATMTVEEAGLLGLVYSFIRQLLQFKVPDTSADLSQERFQRLDGEQQSWPESLMILRELLTQTPSIRYCIIHGLNDLEWSNGAEWCHDILDVLFEYQENAELTFDILLTTSGQSKLLANRIHLRDRCFAQKFARMVERRGRTLDMALITNVETT